MATKILDIDLGGSSAPQSGLEGYSAALFLLRAEGRPVGKVTVAVTDGQTSLRALQRAIPDASVALAAVTAWRKRLAPPLPPLSLSATVAICTRERPDDLRRALASLTLPAPQGQEILVIDNCPATDATRQVTAEFPGARYVVEPVKGLDNARNRAVAEARTEVLAFIDDDAVADPDWLAELVRPFADARVQCVTGLTMPLELETLAQERFESLSGFSMRGFHAREFRTPRNNPLIVGDVGAGVNMAIRLAIVPEIGLFDPALDAGTATQSGGDHEYFTRILKTGQIIAYSPHALNWHRHRRSWDELHRALWGYGVGVYAAWTSTFLATRDWGVFRCAFGWLWHDQLPELWRAWRRPSSEKPLDILWVQMRGCARGPFAYLEARKRAQEGKE